LTTNFPVGWILRASTVEFAVGCRILQPNTPHFGDLVKVPLQPETIDIYGLIYNVEVRDDPAVRQLILVGQIEPEAVLDQRENRLVPIELTVLTVGYEQQGRLFQGLPPQPPLSLNELHICNDIEITQFTKQFDYFRLILDSAHLPADELLIAHLRQAAQTQPPERRYHFLLQAGKAIARLLNNDMVRLDNILRRIKPISDN